MGWGLSLSVPPWLRGRQRDCGFPTRALLKEAARKVWRAEMEGESLPKGLRYKTPHSLQTQNKTKNPTEVRHGRKRCSLN